MNTDSVVYVISEGKLGQGGFIKRVFREWDDAKRWIKEFRPWFERNRKMSGIVYQALGGDWVSIQAHFIRN